MKLINYVTMIATSVATVFLGWYGHVLNKYGGLEKRSECLEIGRKFETDITKKTIVGAVHVDSITQTAVAIVVNPTDNVKEAMFQTHRLWEITNGEYARCEKTLNGFYPLYADGHVGNEILAEIGCDTDEEFYHWKDSTKNKILGNVKLERGHIKLEQTTNKFEFNGKKLLSVGIEQLSRKNTLNGDIIIAENVPISAIKTSEFYNNIKIKDEVNMGYYDWKDPNIPNNS